MAAAGAHVAPSTTCSVRVRSSPCSVSARRFVVGPVGRTRACVGFVSDCADALLGLPKTLRGARATQQGPWARSGDSPTSEPSGESSGTHRALPGSDLPTQVPCHPWGLISTTTWCVRSDSPPSSAPSKDRRGICESHPDKSPVGGDLSCTLGPHRYIWHVPDIERQFISFVKLLELKNNTVKFVDRHMYVLCGGKPVLCASVGGSAGQQLLSILAVPLLEKDSAPIISSKNAGWLGVQGTPCQVCNCTCLSGQEPCHVWHERLGHPAQTCVLTGVDQHLFTGVEFADHTMPTSIAIFQLVASKASNQPIACHLSHI